MDARGAEQGYGHIRLGRGAVRQVHGAMCDADKVYGGYMPPVQVRGSRGGDSLASGEPVLTWHAPPRPWSLGKQAKNSGPAGRRRQSSRPPTLDITAQLGQADRPTRLSLSTGHTDNGSNRPKQLCRARIALR